MPGAFLRVAAGWASLNTSTGVISGTVSGSPAVTSFTVEVTDNDGYTGTQPLSITTIPPLNLQSAVPGIPAPGLFVPGRLITPPSSAKPLQDSPQVNPGLAWLSHFKPGLRSSARGCQQFPQGLRLLPVLRQAVSRLAASIQQACCLLLVLAPVELRVSFQRQPLRLLHDAQMLAASAQASS